MKYLKLILLIKLIVLLFLYAIGVPALSLYLGSSVSSSSKHLHQEENLKVLTTESTYACQFHECGCDEESCRISCCCFPIKEAWQLAVKKNVAITFSIKQKRLKKIDDALHDKRVDPIQSIICGSSKSRLNSIFDANKINYYFKPIKNTNNVKLISQVIVVCFDVFVSELKSTTLLPPKPPPC